MRPLLYAASILAVMGLAFWAYREGYRTRSTARAVDRLEAEIGHAREELSMLRAEWTYLNRPDRLRALAEMNFERLELMQLDAEHFGLVEQVAFPPPAAPAPIRWAELGIEGRVQALSSGAVEPVPAADGEQLP